jgi:photosystem II stability/assembly factor-like uncharacterized protein
MVRNGLEVWRYQAAESEQRWSRIMLPLQDIKEISRLRAQLGRILVTIQTRDASHLISSVDNGLTWRTLCTFPSGTRILDMSTLGSTWILAAGFEKSQDASREAVIWLGDTRQGTFERVFLTDESSQIDRLLCSTKLGCVAVGFGVLYQASQPTSWLKVADTVTPALRDLTFDGDRIWAVGGWDEVWSYKKGQQPQNFASVISRRTHYFTALDWLNEKEGWIGTSDSIVFGTRDGGHSWGETPKLPAKLVLSICARGHRLLVGTDQGLWILPIN